MAALTAGLVAAGTAPGATAAEQDRPGPGTSVLGQSVAQLARRLDAGEATSVRLVQEYQRRIARYDGDPTGGVNAFLARSPFAQADAAALDRERAAGRLRGPLHGVPVVLKDNWDTADLPTTSGSLTLAGTYPPDDAAAVRALRDAGAVVLGKTNLHEFARGITTVSSLGGQTRNPFDQSLNPGGSSGGTAAAVASAFAPVGTGTDTCGSLRIPAAFTATVGFRPTQGGVEMDGIVPLASTQDVAGAIGQTVGDVAVTMDVLARAPGRYTAALGGDPLAGARIGLWTPFVDASDARVRASLDRTLAELRQLGATVVGVSSAAVTGAGSAGVIPWEFAADLDGYLAGPGYRFPPGLASRAAPAAVTLDDILADGRIVPSVLGGMRASSRLDRSAPAYMDRLQRRRQVQDGLDAVFASESLDAVLYPTMTTGAARVDRSQGGVDTCTLSAYSGRPAVSVPNAFPGAPGEGLSPNGVDLLGVVGQDARLLALADHYTRSFTYSRPAPLPTLPASPGCEGTEEATFSDTDGSPHEAAVACLAARQVTRGYADGSFAPGTSVSRGEFASLLARSLAVAGVPAASAPDAFRDDDGSVHEASLDQLAALGVLQGVTPTTAAPSAALTRGQAASLVARAYGEVYAVPPRGRVDAFADDADSVHAASIDGLAALGILRGSAGQALPERDVTRGQMASLLARSLFAPA